GSAGSPAGRRLSAAPCRSSTRTPAMDAAPSLTLTKNLTAASRPLAAAVRYPKYPSVRRSSHDEHDDEWPGPPDAGQPIGSPGFNLGRLERRAPRRGGHRHRGGGGAGRAAGGRPSRPRDPP